jgi:FHA domain
MSSSASQGTNRRSELSHASTATHPSSDAGLTVGRISTGFGKRSGLTDVFKGRSGDAVGILLNCVTRRRIYLRAEHVFGRGRMADTLLHQADASLLHACIRWTGRAWELRDHSRNGTLIDQHRAPPNGPIALTIGAIIEFCRSGHSAWIVENLAKPASVLWPLDEDGPVISLAEVNVLPTQAASELSIRMGPGDQWFCEQGQQTRLLRDGDEVRMAGKSWCFISGTSAQETMELGLGQEFTAGNVLLHFHVSLDEEHVSLKIVGAQHTIGLGERTHHYCLLTLARQRLRDAQRNIDADGQGWIELESLAKMLGVDPSHANILIFRARKQIAQSLPITCVLPDIVERRRGAVRFGHWGVRIVRGSALESMFQPFASSTVGG